MDVVKISFEDIGVIASFVVPGYFAIFGYALVHTKANRAFSRILIESVALSLPLVGLYNSALRHIWHINQISSISVRYFLPLLALSLMLGYTFALTRDTEVSKWISKKMRLRGPSDDFIEVQFKKIKPAELVTVTLKNGDVFSGQRKGLSTYRKGESQRFYFNSVAWYNKRTHRWNRRRGSIIVSMEDVLHIETSSQLPDS